MLRDQPLKRLRIHQQTIAIDLRFVIREDMMAAMLREHGDCPLGFAGNVKRPFELQDGAIHQFDPQLTIGKIEPRPQLLLNIFHRSTEIRRELGRPLCFKLSR